MATYAHYRHVELDKVGCGKKRSVTKTINFPFNFS